MQPIIGLSEALFKSSLDREDEASSTGKILTMAIIPALLRVSRIGRKRVNAGPRKG